MGLQMVFVGKSGVGFPQISRVVGFPQIFTDGPADFRRGVGFGIRTDSTQIFSRRFYTDVIGRHKLAAEGSTKKIRVVRIIRVQILRASG